MEIGTFVRDTFAGSAPDSALTSHTGEVGATWTENGAVNAGVATISSSGRVYIAGTAPCENVTLASGTPASPDYDVEARILRVNGDAVHGGICGRFSASTGDGYLLYHDGFDQGWSLGKMVSGVRTVLGQAFIPFTLTGFVSARYIKLRMRGSNIQALINGEVAIDVTDATFSSAGQAGIYLFAEDPPSSSTGAHVSEFRAGNWTGVLNNADIRPAMFKPGRAK